MTNKNLLKMFGDNEFDAINVRFFLLFSNLHSRIENLDNLQNVLKFKSDTEKVFELVDAVYEHYDEQTIKEKLPTVELTLNAKDVAFQKINVLISIHKFVENVLDKMPVNDKFEFYLKAKDFGKDDDVISFCFNYFLGNEQFADEFDKMPVKAQIDSVMMILNKILKMNKG